MIKEAPGSIPSAELLDHLPAPAGMLLVGQSHVKVWTEGAMRECAEHAVARERERAMLARLWETHVLQALELIAAPKRPDGTWNRDRESCRQLAVEALGRYNDAV